jgi:Heterokaryon incompatibility protein (HET)
MPDPVGGIRVVELPTTYLPPLQYVDDIRLLSHVARTDGKLACSLEAATTNDSYYALSYVWGDFTPCRSILCNGENLHVTTNLYEALYQIWQQHPRRKIWADALCINQNDPIEKSEQVRNMGEVYYSAQEVLIWLGKQIDDTDVEYLFSCVTKRARKMRAGLACSECGEIDWHLHSCSACPPSFHIEAREQHQRMEALLSKVRSNQWFRRMWTFQEICLAGVATVHLGARSIAWKDLAQGLVAYFPRKPHDPWLAEMKWVTEYRGAVDLPDKMRMASLMRATCQRIASEPRDKVYALLGLLRSRSYVAIRRIDYSQSVALLYAEVTRACFHLDDCVELLRYSWPSLSTLEPKLDLLWWSVDWTMSTEIPDPYWAREPIDRRRSFSPHRTMSPMDSDLLSLSVYFVAVGRLAENEILENDKVPATKMVVQSWVSFPTCALKHRVCCTIRAMCSASGSQRFNGMTMTINSEDLAGLSSTPVDNSNILPKLSRHDSHTCDCSLLPTPTRSIHHPWRGRLLQSQQAEPGDWLGIIANTRGSMMGTLCVLRPSLSNRFRLVAWTEDPHVAVVHHPVSTATNDDIHGVEQSYDVNYFLSEISLV